MRRLGLLVVVSCGPHAAPSPKPVDRTVHVALTPQMFHLRNGLTAMLVPDPDAELAGILTQVHAGAIDDPTPGVARLAAYHSYAPTVNGATRWDQLARHASSIDARPAPRETQFTARFDPSRLAEVLRIEAGRLSAHCDAHSATYFPQARDRVVGEIRDLVNWTLEREFRHATFPTGDPRATVYDATSESVAAITEAQVCAFEDRYYVPANTTLVVSGRFARADFEQALDAAFGELAPGVGNERPADAPIARGTDATIAADVDKPSTAVTYVLPRQPIEHERLICAIKLAATVIDPARIAWDDDTVTLWFGDDLDGAAKVKALAVDAKVFEETRMLRVTELLDRLDNLHARLPTVAEQPILETPFAALAKVTERDITAALDLANARVLRLTPSGKRWRPAMVGAPGHEFRGVSAFVDEPSTDFEPHPSHVLAHARTLSLPNGMTVALVPTSPIPLVHIALAFSVGSSSDPAGQPGTAEIAISALDRALARIHPFAGIHNSSNDGDTSVVTLRGPTIDVDQLLAQFTAIGAPRLAVDQQFMRERISRLPPPRAQVRPLVEALFGADHPYAHAAPPSARMDAAAIDAFAKRYLQPNNATLVITGGFDPATVEPLVRTAFAGWSGTGEVPKLVSPHPTGTAFAIDDPTGGVAIHISWIAPDSDVGDEAREILADDLAAISGETTASFSRGSQAGVYNLSAHVAAADGPRMLVKMLAGVVDAGKGKPTDRKTFERERVRYARYLADFGTSAIAWQHGVLGALRSGHDLAWLANRNQRAAATNYDEMGRLVKDELLAPGRMVLGVSGPHDAVTATYAELGIVPTWL